MLRKKYEKENFAAPRVRIFFDTRSDGNNFFLGLLLEMHNLTITEKHPQIR